MMDILLWYHRDLRLTDHLGLSTALTQTKAISAVAARPSSSSPRAAKFHQESLLDLERNLECLQIPLRILDESEIPFYLRNQRAEFPDLKIFTSKRFNSRDQRLLQHQTQGIPDPAITLFNHSTLFDENNLPFPIVSLPSTFTPFQKAVQSLPVPAALTAPIQLTPFTGEMPVQLVGREFHFKGGESAGSAHLGRYLSNSNGVNDYHKTRNGLLKVDDSSKLSPYLALGCLSVRMVYQELLKRSGPGAEKLRYELIWREYFKWLGLLYQDQLFQARGLKDQARESHEDQALLNLWKEGRTGNAFIDAHMKELRLTGWMSNRGRQNVASFLSKTLNLPWLLGAEWFENHLIDFDPETNQGNWMYLAGVGTDPRDRTFNPDRQAEVYDPEFEYRRRWSS